MPDPAMEPNGKPDRLKLDDEQTLAELFSQHRERLFRIVQFRLDPRLYGRVDADDILQEAYLDASQRIRHFQDDSSTSFFVWLRMVVNQTLVDVHRRHLGAQMRDAGREVSGRVHGHSDSTATSLAVHLAGSITSPSQAAIREETARRLEAALDQMDAIDREVLALRHFEELTNSEVAQVLGIQQKAASIRYIRALKRFKALLANLPGFAGDDHPWAD
jgi:RNA polymerase sigma-70 factor (ECF subfamily)